MRKLRPRVRERITAELGQPVKVIIYGSQARGDATKYSDVDLLVIVPSLDKRTRNLISDITWEVGFGAGKVISAMTTTDDEMNYYAILPFYKNVKEEGIRV